MGASLGELELSKDEQEEGRRTQMTDMSNSKRNKSSRKGKSDSEEKKNNSVSVVVSVVGAQMDDMTPTELKCPPTIEKTKTLKTKASAVTENDESCNTPNRLPSTPSIAPAKLSKRLPIANEEEDQVEIVP